jgi:hypothetical protein
LITHYFIDEAGDSTLFDKHGNVIIGNEGNSSFFILGLLKVGDPYGLRKNIDQLREDIINDPYFEGVPSLDPKRKRTAIAFHATDDPPEVRYKVFELLRQRDDISFFAVVGEKRRTLEYVFSRQRLDSTYHYRPDEMYDFLCRRLFKDRLHLADEYQVIFAQRGNKKRTQALKSQLDIAQERRLREIPKDERPKIHVRSGLSRHHAGLQAVDYYLWALQRCYERGEDRFLRNIWDHCKLIIDIDDKRNNKYGEYYNGRKLITADCLRGRK